MDGAWRTVQKKKKEALILHCLKNQEYTLLNVDYAQHTKAFKVVEERGYQWRKSYSQEQ